MKIILIYPKFDKFLSPENCITPNISDYFLGDFTTPPSLGIPIIASLTPPDIDLEFIDDNSGEEINFNDLPDLVAINCFTPQATRAYAIADAFRELNVKVIMGGIFPSFMVDECLKHADAVNIGEVELTWQQIIEDTKAGKLKKKYYGGCRFDLRNLKTPRREIFYNKKGYTWEEDLVQVTRGCLYNCAMCALPAHMGSRIRYRPIDQVVDEIRNLKFENVYLADDVLFFPHRKINEYACELLKKLIPLKKKFFVSSSLSLKTDREFLKLIAQAGICNFYCTFNVDPISIKAFNGGKKEQQLIIDLVKTLEDLNVRFFGSFAIGRDWDDEGIADKTLEICQRAGIRTAEFFLYTPYPGTKHWERLERQGRIFDKNWSHYNGAYVVAEHPTLSMEQLYNQFNLIWKEFFNLQKKRHLGSLEPLTYSQGKVSVGIPLQKQGIKSQAVVTGIGLISPLGNELNEVASALENGRSGLAPIKKIDTSFFSTSYGGEIKSFQVGDYMNKEEQEEYTDLYLQYALVAARKALADAGITINNKNKYSLALVLGTCNGGLLSAEEEYKWKHHKSDKIFDEKSNLQAQCYGFGKALASSLGIGGEAWIVTTACSSSTSAIGLAQTLIKHGRYDIVLLGGSDSLCVANMTGFNGLKAISHSYTAPFSQPYGLNIGEAACFWVVESLEKAILRQAQCYAKIIGHATTSDAYHPTAPDPRGDGVYRTLTLALKNSQLPIEKIGCINAHGTGTEANDKAENKGINRFLNGTHIPVISLKSFFGHCMGSTGLLEASCSILAMNKDFIPPTLNFTHPRPGCNLDYVPNTSRKKIYDAFISTNSAFGGNNAAAVIGKWDISVHNAKDTKKRVVISSTGLITSLGIGIEKNLDALMQNSRGIKKITRFNCKIWPSQRAGWIPDFKASEINRRLDFSGMNRISQFATAASSLALNQSGLRINRKNSEAVGIALGVCNGPCESEHMDSVFSSDTFVPHLNCFSNITVNSTTGWVSKALYLKGNNITLAPGPHAGLQALVYAYETLIDGPLECMLVSAADEIYYQTYFNYNLLDFLHQGEYEKNYQLSFTFDKRKVLGEGAATLMTETLEHAQTRDTTILAEILGYGMSMDTGTFSQPNLSSEGLEHACDLAFKRSGIQPEAIDLIVWAPQGNAQDKKVIATLQNKMMKNFHDIPLVTTSFNTGFIESTSILVSLAATLESLKRNIRLWPQITGDQDIDRRTFSSVPQYILVLASSDVGYNYVLVLKNGQAL